MRVGRRGMMYWNSMTVGIVEISCQVILTLKWVPTHNQVQVKRTRSFQSGNDGVGSSSQKAKLQTKEVE